jgi:hypothetical protein
VSVPHTGEDIADLAKKRAYVWELACATTSGLGPRGKAVTLLMLVSPFHKLYDRAPAIFEVGATEIESLERWSAQPPHRLLGLQQSVTVSAAQWCGCDA